MPSIATTFNPEQERKLRRVAELLSLKPQQLIKLAVEEYLVNYDPFVMAGGRYPDGTIQDDDNRDNRVSGRNEREVAKGSMDVVHTRPAIGL